MGSSMGGVNTVLHIEPHLSGLLLLSSGLLLLSSALCELIQLIAHRFRVELRKCR